MISEQLVRYTILNLEEMHRDVLSLHPASNEDVVLGILQVQAIAKLRTLYGVLEEEMPRYNCTVPLCGTHDEA